jgi:hypothetical protein
MLERAKMRALPVINRMPDVTQAAQACCGVCRTCTTTNIVAVGGTLVTAGALYAARLCGRLLKTSSERE